MANPVSSVDCPLSIFGSWNTELSPPDQPEGSSPANNDVVYLPGSVSTRPGLNRVFTAPISSLGPTSYEKSFVTPSGDIKNLYFTLPDGKLWVEDVTNSPGIATLLFQSAGATYASSCTALGREYIALSDGVHGVDIPLAYDGSLLYRLTQDGPGNAPTVASTALPPVAMATGSAPSPVTVTTAQTNIPVQVGPPSNRTTIYQGIVYTVSSTTGLVVGQLLTVSGNSNSNLNASSQIQSITGNLVQLYVYNATFQTGTGGTATPGGGGITMTRANNQVTVTTATAHQLQIGFQAQITGAGVTQVGGISSIVLNNEDTPGIATVTTASAHGLLPGNQVTIAGVNGTTVGTGITNVAFAGDFVTITTSTAHGLAIGSEVLVAAVTNTTVNGQWVVASVPSATTFTYAFVSIVTAYSAVDTGTVMYVWPLASVDPSQDYFTVQTAPTATTFTIGLSYPDGTWTGGTVSFGWDGTFFVNGVPSSTTFTYLQYGPNATNTTVGKVTPYGQIAPGIHQCRYSFLLQDGTITPPSPYVQFMASGGQYIVVSNLVVGLNPYVVGRIVQFTGAGGAYFFYIPTPAQVNGQTVSTATQINDNTTTSILMDFSDNTLYAAEAVSIPGNDLSAQRVLAPQAGMFTYASRLQTWGGVNKVENFLNMGFNGGEVGAIPTGWQSLNKGGAGGIATGFSPSRLSIAVIMNVTSTPGDYSLGIQQSAYLDVNGAPILLPNTQYTFKFWAAWESGFAGNIVASLTSASTGFTATATIPASQINGLFTSAAFSAITPSPIPPDLMFSVILHGTGTASLVQMTDLEMIYTDQPYLDNQEFISYAENLGAFDKNTGVLGSTDDLSPIRNHGTIRQTLYIVTGTGLHETEDNGQTEPSGWEVLQVADNCGAFSVASVARNAQGIGSAGKDWMMWSGPDGAQMFTGQKPYKVSQEIQSVWDAIPASQQYQCWVKNYESAKWCFFGVPTSGSTMQTLVLDYRNIDGGAIAENPPVHISFTGKMIVSDLTRKWTSWTLPAWCGELMYRANATQPQIVFGCLTPSGGANSYILNANQFFDDDYGVIPASYTTYFFVSHEQEQAFQVGSHRHIYTMAQAFISGVGNWFLTPLAASLSNPFPASPQLPLSSDPFFDVDFGINVPTTRCAFRIQASPIAPSLNSYFKLQKLVINMAKDPHAPVRGSVTGNF